MEGLTEVGMYALRELQIEEIVNIEIQACEKEGDHVN